MTSGHGSHVGMGGMGSMMQECIKACSDCHDVCLQTMTHCLTKGGMHAEVGHITTLADCAQICETSADFMLRGSMLHKVTCGACAEVCRACAESCEAMADDEMMRRCAEECRRCEESCRRMAQA
jgi:hypothetical protein